MLSGADNELEQIPDAEPRPLELIVMQVDREALEGVANDLEGYAMHIREYLRGDIDVLPTRWDIQDAYEAFKAAVSI